MVKSKKILPLKVNSDLSSAYIDQFTARYLKNVTAHESATDAYPNIKEGNNAASLKKMQSNELYVPFSLPEGLNYCIGAKGFAVTNEVYCFIWNSNNNHSIYRVNGNTRTSDLVYRSPDLKFKLNPENFVASIVLIPVKLTDPDTNITVLKRDLYWCEGSEDAGYLRVDDAIASNGFDSQSYPYFSGNYDRSRLVRVGFDAPDTEISIAEIPATAADAALPNELLFNGFQFRRQATNVFGVPSEHGIISDLYVSGKNDCMSSSSRSPRCLSLTFDAGTPFTNTIDIEYRIGNSPQWYKDTTLFLYEGSTVGEWWKRSRNPNITYNASTNEITYTFCNNGERVPISTDETNRVENPVPKKPQVLFELNNKLALANNEHGFSPFKQSVVDNCVLDIVSSPTNLSGTRNITIYFAIYNFVSNFYSSVGGDSTNPYYFGDNYPSAKDGGQAFANTRQSGFLVYLNDGDSAISTQVYLNGSGALVDDPTHQGRTLSPFGFTLQKVVFTDKKPATYIARLASHRCDPSITPNYQKTSTTVWGNVDFTYSGTVWNIDRGSRVKYYSQELLINCCSADYDTLTTRDAFGNLKMLLIVDVSDNRGTPREKLRVGYITEGTSTGGVDYPMELMSMDFINGSCSLATDHNGFYYHFTQGRGRKAYYAIMNNCAVYAFDRSQDNARYNEYNFTIDSIANGFTLLACNRVEIKGRIVLFGSNIPIPNLSVVYTRGGVASTNDNGEFTLVCHDDMRNTYRKDYLVIGGGGCAFTDVGGGCIPIIEVDVFRCQGGCTTREYNIGEVKLDYQNFKSLLSGGKYAGALIGHDGLRVTYAQPLNLLNIPSIIQSQAISTYQARINLLNGVVFPTDLKYLTVAVSRELTIEDYISWIVDRVEFVDNTGAVNLISPSQIKIYYASLNQFNAANNYNTTTNWSFIAEGTASPVVGDRVQFLVNGGGQFFTKNISSVVKYDTVGQYFLIDYNSELSGLQPNAFIRIYRPRQTSNTETTQFFEVPNSRIELTNGVPNRTSFLLNYYDTYFLSRQIPVPTQLNAIPIVTTITTTTTSGATEIKQVETQNTTNTVISLKNFGLRFESKSPSNLWGKNINNQGRVFTKNEYEQVLHKINEVAVTGTLSINGALNYMQYFSDSLFNDFDVKNTLGISGAVADVGVVFFLTQYDNFRVGYDDNLLRVDSSGNVGVAQGSSLWGKPERRAGENYGCQLKDKSSIQTYNGMTMFLDRNRCEVLQYNFSSFKSLIKDETELLPNVQKGKIDSSFRAKLKAIASDETKYFVGGINPLTGKYLLTDFSLKNISYINQDREPSKYNNDTVVFDIDSGDVSGYASFTPEMYAWLDGDLLNKQMFAFSNATVFSHNNVFRANSFNNFFGVQCESVIEIVCPSQALSQVFFLALSNYCKQQLLFADRVLTQVQQVSYLLKDAFKQSQFFSSAPFMRDINTLTDANTTQNVSQNVQSEGNPLYGQWIQIRLIGDPDYSENYMEYFGSEVSYFESERSPILERGQANI